MNGRIMRNGDYFTFSRICGVQEYAGLEIEALRNPQQERRCAPHILGVF